jgi:hypothetical protein
LRISAAGLRAGQEGSMVGRIWSTFRCRVLARLVPIAAGIARARCAHLAL